MVRIIQFAVVALVLYGAWQAGSAQLDQFKFEDAVRQIAEFHGAQEDDDIRATVVAEGGRIGIRVDPARVIIRREAGRIYVDVTYTRLVQILPWYRYNWAFAVNAESWLIPGSRSK